jgi:hypothetical protein
MDENIEVAELPKGNGSIETNRKGRTLERQCLDVEIAEGGEDFKQFGSETTASRRLS